MAFGRKKKCHISTNLENNLLSWKNGIKKPTFKQLEKISKSLNIPVGYFFLENPPKEHNALVEYRTINSDQITKPSRNLTSVIHSMERIQNWVEDYLISEKIGKNTLVGIFNSNITSSNCADLIRQKLQIPIDWFNNTKNIDDSFKYLRKLLSKYGIIVMMSGVVNNNTSRPLDLEEFRAFTLINDYAPLIFINSQDSSSGKLFSLLHEFSHICFGENSLYNVSRLYEKGLRNTEKDCNMIASELLVPQKIFIKKWNERCSICDNKKLIEELAKFFRCGLVIVARKAFDNGFIENDLYNEIANNAKYHYINSKDSKGGNYYNNLTRRIDGRFLSMLCSSVMEGKTLHTEAYKLTDTSRKVFDKLLNNIERYL